MVPTPTVNDNVIQALEDERTGSSQIPLLVLSEEVDFLSGSGGCVAPNGQINLVNRRIFSIEKTLLSQV